MAIRYPKVHVATEEIVHPNDWNNNLGEFVNEINGNLDSDNFNDAIPEAAFKSKSFTEVFYNRSNTTNVVLNTGTLAWQDRDSNSNLMPVVTFDAETDGLILVEGNARVQWRGNGIPNGDSILSADGDDPRYETLFDDYLLIQYPFAHTGGSTATQTGFWEWGGGIADGDLPSGGWVGCIRDEGVNSWDNRYRGTSLKKGNFPAGRWINRPIDFYGIKFRLLVNGEAVSETGWLYNGNYRNGTFLCGAAPVSAGRNRVVMEARIATLHDLKPHPAGVGSKHRQDSSGDIKYIRGKFVSTTNTSTVSAETPLPGLSALETGSISIGKNGETLRFKEGIDVFVADRNMTVTFRKR